MVRKASVFFGSLRKFWKLLGMFNMVLERSERIGRTSEYLMLLRKI